ncbi:hypothetical protein EDC52_1059 [Biostraticola tofi]|uniref:Uncharacterized protein n=1 Tax=Biostraticola tofi TaxID=466109 RepID=A0A4R3YRC9_9GAMM|nr:hypothetical protein EDC52_1059 [Biostraticola tofi]
MRIICDQVHSFVGDNSPSTIVIGVLSFCRFLGEKRENQDI